MEILSKGGNRRNGSFVLVKSRGVQTPIHFFILNLFLISFCSATSRGDISHLQYADETTADAPASSRACLFVIPLDSPMEYQLAKGFPCLVQFARGLAGRIDITSVRSGSGTIEPTHQEGSSKDSIRATDCNYASIGQDTKHLGSPDKSGRQHHSIPALSRDKRITKESPASNPLSFAWEYLETKK
jgi:hypothetical protein